MLNFLLKTRQKAIVSHGWATHTNCCLLANKIKASNYSAIMNADYQELINVILWKKSRNDITLPEFVRVCLCNLLVINNSLYALLLNSY